MLYARLGDVRRGTMAQDQADATRPASLPRFATHMELHRALIMAHAGDQAGGAEYGRRAMAPLPPSRRSQTLRLVMSEVEAAGRRLPERGTSA